MIAHVVLFRPRADLPADDRHALAVSFERAIREVPSVRRATVGRRRLHGAGYEASQPDYPYAAIIEFDDLGGLQAYLQHPAHAEPARRFFASLESALIVDYEMTDGRDVAGRVAGWLD